MMNRPSKRIVRIVLMFLMACLPLAGYSQTLDDAVDEAVSQLKYRGLADRAGKEMIIEVVNYHSKKFDREARVIRSSLFTSLQAQFPETRILLEEESITGVSAKAVLIKGTYQPQGTLNIVELRAVDRMSGRMFAKADSSYQVERQKFENLVAVLPLDAPTLDKQVARTFSKILRSALNKTGAFNLVSSDVIDSADADEIQEQYQCSREECSAIVAEQVNASQVITTQYNRIAPGVFFLTASLKDIKTGRTLKEEAIQHNGDLKTLPQELENLALKLGGTSAVAKGPAPAAGRTGMLVVKSNPTEASILLDGRPLPEKTDTLLQNLPIGKHELVVYKGKLGARQTVILIPDKTEQIKLRLKPAKADLQVQSTPSAKLYIDGVYKGRTPIVVKIDGGKHIVELKKKEFQTVSKKVTGIPFVANKLQSRLIPLPELEVVSDPSGAAVFMDGRPMGKTPLTIRSKSGPKKIVVKLDGYQDFKAETTVKPYGKNRITAELTGVVILKISVSPPGARVEVDGRYIGGGQETTYENIDDLIELEARLLAGKHRIEVSHPEARKTVAVDVELFPEVKDNWEEIRLELNSNYLTRLKRDYEMEDYRSELITWRWKWGLSVAGTVAFAAYAYQQNQKAVESSELQIENEEAILSAKTAAEGDSYREKALAFNEEVKSCNLNSQASALVSLSLLGIAAWIWLDDPDEPTGLSWQTELTPKGEIKLSLNASF
ncbi:MAG: PEGA domain-containing protein [Proteobacteria bacterium]|nr:PEGA domain-containing protein [Pseudomonadota bacterium]